MTDQAKKTRIAIACQGGGSHAAYVSGALRAILERLTEQYEIAGLSGTSGGAHCALIAWYWMLKDGTERNGWGRERAIEELATLWHDNAPMWPSEMLWNWWVVRLSSSPVEVAASPYRPPLSTTADLLKLWPRKEFVDIGALLQRDGRVDFAEIAAVGSFQKLAKEARAGRLIEAAQDLALFAGTGPEYHHGDLADLKQRYAIAARGINELAGFGLCKQLVSTASRAIQKSGDFAGVDDALRQLALQLPYLLLGAVNVRQGTFKAFDSRKGEISLQAVLASAAIPWIFQAVPADNGDPCWDGLFSQNPPTKDFISGADGAAEKPDELWVLQINPQCCDEAPEAPERIADRRNELTCNLSLNQELAFVKSVNKWSIDGTMRSAGATPDEARHRFIGVHWIRMHSPTLEQRVGELNTASKANRDRVFVDELMIHGAEQVALFWPVRRLIEEIFNSPAASLHNPRTLATFNAILTAHCVVTLPGQIAAKGSAGSEPAISWSPPGPFKGITAIAGAIEGFRGALPELRIIVEGMDIIPNGRVTDTGEVTLDWAGHALLQCRRRITMVGKAALAVGSGKIERIAISPIVIEAIKPV